jgi:putative tricarboxylic transport membrane protein
MTDDNTSTRRNYLKWTTAAGIAGLAGCSGGDGGDSSSSGGTDSSDGGSSSSSGGDYPSRRMTFVAWASRGGGSDTIVRQGYLRSIRENDLVPTDIRAINQTGGGGEAGMRYTLDQDPDGHTILNVTTNLVVTPLSRDIGISYQGFTPIARMGVEPILLVVRGDDDRFSTIEEFQNYATENSVSIASFDVGTQDHTAAFLLSRRTDMNAEIVPFSGGGEQVSALLAGDVDAAVTAPSEVSDQRESGEVEYALHFSGQELELYPDVPYVNQAFGTEIVVEQFRGAVVHGDTPDERVEYLRDLFEDIYNTDEFEAYADNNNVNPAFLRGEEFYNYVEGVDERFNKVFQENNLGVYSDN